ncbi:hypothetical protein V6Z11_D01G116900 [Gossypium hirsutum]
MTQHTTYTRHCRSEFWGIFFGNKTNFSTMDQLNSKCQLLPTDGPHFFPWKFERGGFRFWLL